MSGKMNWAKARSKERMRSQGTQAHDTPKKSKPQRHRNKQVCVTEDESDTILSMCDALGNGSYFQFPTTVPRSRRKLLWAKAYNLQRKRKGAHPTT